jgi:gamma-glutamylaminecyclotransferase
MCVIIIKQKGQRLPKEVAKTSARLNPHGLGVMWTDTFEVTYHKSSEHKVLLSERPYIAHFRYATVGAINRENTHPFQCGKNTNEWLMMNGTIYGLGNKEKSDSRVLAELLGDIPRHTWKKELAKHPCRFVTINTRNKTYQIYNKDLWTESEGIWYSKANVLEHHMVAVYGTLKRGYGNHRAYLEDSRYIGKGKTYDKYPLVVEGLPYLMEKKGKGHNVEVEVYMVDDSTLMRLDQLEGHPNWYRRKQIPIKLSGGRVVQAWIYFNLNAKGEVYHKSYEKAIPFINQYDDADEFTIADEGPVCVNCFHDLEHDHFNNYYCKSCNEWFSEKEIIKFGCQI